MSDPSIISDGNSILAVISWREWSNVANSIRLNADRLTCNENLSLFLSNIGPIEAQTYNAASGALTLLPTAGALIGSPTQELWIVYKLMPLAGTLSMLLSLGGNIIPSNAKDYELNPSSFTYGGLIATQNEMQEAEELQDRHNGLPGPQAFAAKVKARSEERLGGTRCSRVWIGIAIQFFLVSLVVGACWFAQSGSVLVWWCTNWGWMFFWYLLVASSSLLENWASVPFSNQYTLRISRAPKIHISDDAPLVTKDLEMIPRSDSDLNTLGPGQETPENRTPFLPRSSSNQSAAVLEALETGYDCKGGVVRDEREPWSSSLMPFYVIISLESISTAHAIVRGASKLISISVFAMGTAIFASSQLVGISIAVTTLAIVLGSGVFGRVVALWMASEMMRGKPVMHRVVKRKADASKYVEEILRINGLTVETLGHVIVNGRCIARYSPWFRWSSWLGVLASPFDVRRLAV